MSLVPRIIAGVLALFLAAPAAVPAHAQEAEGDLPTLAVLDLQDGGSIGPDVQDLSNLGTGIAMMLTTEMMRNPRVDMVERDRIQDLIQEQKLTLGGVIDQSTAIEVGRLVGAHYMLFGTYTDVMSELRIDVRVVDVETGRLQEAREVTRSREELFAMVSQLAEDIFEELDLESPREASGDREPIPARAVVHFSKAVGYEDRGNAEMAAEEYRKALEIHPDYQQAQERLARIEGGEGS